MRTTPELSILQYNVRRSKNKVMAPLFRHDGNLDYSVIAIQEPWLNTINPDNITTHHPRGDKYELYWPKGPAPRVCLFINKDIPATQWTCFEHSPDLVSIRLTFQEDGGYTPSQLWVHNLYRLSLTNSHSQQAEHDASFTLNLWEEALRAPGEHITVGDFNSHNPTWGGVHVRPDYVSGRILEIMDAHSLGSLLEEGTITRTTLQVDQEDSTIDLVLADEAVTTRLIRCDIHEPAEFDSDHKPILTTLNAALPKAPPRKMPKWKAIDREQFQKTLENSLPTVADVLSSPLGKREINSLVDNIVTALQGAIKVSVPLTEVSPYSKPGFDAECKEAIRQSHRLRRRWQRERNEEAREDYKRARNDAGRLVARRLMKNHRENIERAARDPSGIFKLAKWAKNRGERRLGFTPALKNPDGTMATEPADKAAALKRSFFPTPTLGPDHDMRLAIYPTPLPCPLITEQELREAIHKTKPGKAPGPDDIPNQIVRAAEEQLTPLLLPIFNACLEQGVHPEAWKTAITVSLRKAGKPDYSAPKAYRPIALLSTLGKVLESIIAQRLAYWAEEHQLLPPGHVGGRRALGVEHALHLMLERIHAAFTKEGLVATLLSLDATGAFDYVNRQRLIHNLKMRRIPIWVVNWLASFLQGRKTVIKMPEYTSQIFEVLFGIPQGSPLSPILYIFYNAGLIEITNVPSKNITSVGYIDDVNALIIGPSAEANNAELARLYEQRICPWAEQHCAVFNPDKFALMHFTRDKKQDINAPLHLAGSITLQPVQELRMLGIWLDPKLNWSAHRRHVEASSLKKLNCMQALCGSTWGFSLSDVRKLYTGTVVPSLMHGSSTWYAPSPPNSYGTRIQEKAMVRTLTAIQKRAAAIIAGAFRLTAGAALDIELYLLPVKQRLEEYGAFALLRIAQSRISPLIAASRPLAARRPARWSPLQRLEQRWWNVLQETVWKDLNRDLYPLESKTPFIVPPWWNGVKTVIARTKEQAIKDHDDVTSYDSFSTMTCYTDGSAHNGRVGAAYVAQGLGLKSSLKVGMGPKTVSTVYAAELQGVRMALERAVEVSRRGLNRLNIFTDNQGSIRTVQRPKVGPSQWLLRRIVTLLDILQENEITVTIRWIPAHIGVSGNELVDQLAKDAVSAPQLEGLHASAASLKRAIRQYVEREWAADWSVAKHGRVTFALVPKPIKKILTLHSRLTKPMSAVIVQARTGKIGLRSYLFSIGKVESRYCLHCTNTPESLRHVLLDCPKYARLRAKHFGAFMHWNLKDLLNDNSRTKNLANFLIQSRLLGQFHAVEEARQRDSDSLSPQTLQ